MFVVVAPVPLKGNWRTRFGRKVEEWRRIGIGAILIRKRKELGIKRNGLVSNSKKKYGSSVVKPTGTSNKNNFIFRMES